MDGYEERSEMGGFEDRRVAIEERWVAKLKRDGWLSWLLA